MIVQKPLFSGAASLASPVDSSWEGGGYFDLPSKMNFAKFLPGAEGNLAGAIFARTRPQGGSA